jgi:tRNA pseudouridine32 synthase/23S rRNA pseudouridine746 synthase
MRPGYPVEMMHPSPHLYAPPAEAVIDIVYEDEYLLVVDKPSGLLSVPGRGEDKQDSLIWRLQRVRPEALIVHRLDMDTSGLMVLARDKAMHRALSLLFQRRQVEKCYVAVVAGRVEEDEGVIELPLITDWPRRPLQKVDHALGKPAVTRFRTLGYSSTTDTTRVELRPITGRSHQLRVHMQQLGHPILGDRLYASETVQAGRLLLHAGGLALVHPASGQGLSFTSAAPF